MVPGHAKCSRRGIGLGACAPVVHEYLDVQKHAMGALTPEHDLKHTR